MHLVLCLVGLPPLPLGLGRARGVEVLLGSCLAWAGSLPPLLCLRAVEVWKLPALDRLPFPVSPSLWTLPHSHRTFHDVRMWGSLQALAPALYPPAIHALRCVNRGRIRGLGLERVALVDVAVSLALAPLPVRGQEVESVRGGHRPRHARLVVAHVESGRGLLTAIALGHVVTGPDPRIGIGHAVDRSRRERSRSVARDRSRRERARSPARRRGRRDRSRSHASSSRSFDRSRSRERLSASSSRSREDGAARRARRGIQEGVEAVASQPAVVPGGSGDVTPVAGGTSMTALLSAMKELARFFLNLSGSSSLGASGDSAGVTASGAALGDLAGPSSSAPGAATICGTAAPPAGAGVLPDVSDALPSVSGERRRRVRSRSRDRRGRSSSDRTDRRAKKRSRRGSPSPERSSRRREKRYRSSSDSSEDVRAAASSPRSRRAHGGAHTGGSTWDYGRSRSYARVDPSQSGTHRRSPGPSGVAEDDRSSTFESVDFARDVSFRAVLGLIREFHDMAEPATVPAARCKTSLASAFGLAADSYPSFALPLSPLLSTLLMDINSDLSKFMEDQTMHGFLPVPGRRQRRYYGTSTSSFPGPYTVPPGLTSITMEKAS